MGNPLLVKQIEFGEKNSWEFSNPDFDVEIV